MIGTVVDYGTDWVKVLSGERLFCIEMDTKDIRMGQDFEFDSTCKNVTEVISCRNGG